MLNSTTQQQDVVIDMHPAPILPAEAGY